MELTLVAVALLAGVIFVLSGFVGYIYLGQTRNAQRIQSMAAIIAKYYTPHNEPEAVVAVEVVPEPEKEDDRVSVSEPETEVITGVVEPSAVTAAVDIDDLESKKTPELREMLSKKGIPFSKRDAKPILIQLLKTIS